MMPYLDIEGERYGRLIVQNRVPRFDKKSYWLCLCDCGALCKVLANSLRTGATKSCGCLSREKSAVRCLDRTKHGASRVFETHALYKILAGMKRRCNNIKDISYHNYGGLGIKVCKEWEEDYTKFRDHMLSLPGCPPNMETSEHLTNMSIDRIRGKEDYKPGNVKWSTKKEQSNNRRNTIRVVYNGEKMSLKEACEKRAVIDYKTVWIRLKNNWPLKEAFLLPLRARKPEIKA